MFLSGFFSLSIFIGCNGSNGEDAHLDHFTVNEETFKGFINPEFARTGYHKLSINNYDKEKINREKSIILEKILKKEIYVHVNSKNSVSNELCNIFGINHSSIKISSFEEYGCEKVYNFSDSPEELKFILSDFACKNFTGCETNHISLGLLVYDPNKKLNNFELIEIIHSNNNCKLVEEINKRLRKIQLWKYIPVFLGCFFAFIGLLFLLFKSDDEVYKNKMRRKKIGAINLVDNGGKSERRSKNRVRNKNNARNRINKNIKKRVRKNKRRFVRKKV